MFSREANPGLGRSGRVLPRLESLEDRCCPSSVSFSNHILTLQGDSTNSTMIVRDDGHGDVKVTLNGHLTSVSGVQEIIFNSKSASDTINYALTNTLTHSEQFQLNLGSGNDQVKLDFSKGVSAPSLKVNINGGGGGDRTIETDFGAITNTDLALSAQLGSEWDHFTANFNGNLAGKAKAAVNVQGGAGFDGVNIRAVGAIGANAQMSVVEHLGQQANTSHFDYTGKLDGKLSLQVQGGDSWNWLESHFNLLPGSTGSLVAHELGGASADLLILMVNNAGSHLKSLDALINGGGGLNSAEHTSNVKVLNAH
jgi:hypothetical protein